MEARAWTCAVCTVFNVPTAEKCSVCNAPRPPPGSTPPPDADPDESKRDAPLSDFASSLQTLAHPPKPEELQLRVAELTSELEGRDVALQEKDAVIAGLRELVESLRELLLEEREERRSVVDGLWKTIKFTYAMLDRATLAVSPAVSSPGTTAGAGAGTDGGAPAPPTDSPGLFRSESETAKVDQVHANVKTHETLTQWQDAVATKQARVNSSILTRTWAWREKARETARNKAETQATTDMMKAFLIEKKRSGYPLDVQEENFLNVKDHYDGKVYDCEACFDEFTLDRMLVLECGHSLCLTCMQAFVVAEIEQGRYNILSCPETECDHRLHADEVKLALGTERAGLWARFQELMLEDHLARDPNLIRCPKPRCQTPMITEPTTTMVVCPKPACNYSFCCRCKVEWHSDSTCAKYQEWVKENGSAEDRYKEWAEKNTRPCPREAGGCGRPIQKSGGCNHMTCTRCRFNFCWLCNKEYKSGHFSSGGPCAGKQFT